MYTVFHESLGGTSKLITAGCSQNAAAFTVVYSIFYNKLAAAGCSWLLNMKAAASELWRLPLKEWVAGSGPHWPRWRPGHRRAACRARPPDTTDCWEGKYQYAERTLPGQPVPPSAAGWSRYAGTRTAGMGHRDRGVNHRDWETLIILL